MTDGADHAPTRLSAGLAVATAGIAGTLALGGAGWWILLSPLAVLGVGAGLWRSDRRVLAAGCGLLIAAALVAGLDGAGPARLVAAVALIAVAWDTGERAIDLGDGLGRRADTRRLELVGAGTSVAVAGVAAVPAYALYVLAAGARPAATLILMLVGAVVLLVALRVE